MRWKSRLFLQDRLGEERIVEKFLLFPRFYEDHRHVYWLETAKIVERICRVDVGGSCQWGEYAYKWMEQGVVDELARISAEAKKQEEALRELSGEA